MLVVLHDKARNYLFLAKNAEIPVILWPFFVQKVAQMVNFHRNHTWVHYETRIKYKFSPQRLQTDPKLLSILLGSRNDALDEP